MGVRLYNPSTAAFLSADPVQGGNATDYGYPTDPINKTDLSGRFEVATEYWVQSGAAWGGEGFQRKLSAWADYFRNAINRIVIALRFGTVDVAGEAYDKGIYYNHVTYSCSRPGRVNLGSSTPPSRT